MWADNCTLLLVAGRNTSGASLLAGVTTVRVRDDVLELYDEREQLRRPSTAESVTMSGTFGAAEGRMGRSDPLRQAMNELALARFEPQPNCCSLGAAPPSSACRPRS